MKQRASLARPPCAPALTVARASITADAERRRLRHRPRATGRVADIDRSENAVSGVASASAASEGDEPRHRSPIFDSQQSFTLCCVVVDPRTRTSSVGTGENASQRSAHFGDGVYKSTDAGKTWKRMGLENSEHIGKILVDPRNSNTVYVASQGPLFSAGGERGLYKTTDGGATWTAILTISPDTGISDIIFDPKNPDIIFASAYQRRRAVGQMIGGGPEGGIFKTSDAGKKWTKLTKGCRPVRWGASASRWMDGRRPRRSSRSSMRSVRSPGSSAPTTAAARGRESAGR